MIKAVFFDMDGTLINSDELVKKCYQAIMNVYPIDPPLTSSQWQAITAPSAEAVFSQYWPHTPSHLLWQIYQSTLNQNQHALQLFPGVKEMLTALRQQGIKLGLITSEYRDIAIKELAMLGIVECFDGIVCVDDVTNPKPDAEPVNQLMAKLNLASYEVLFVGDQRTDFESARSAKVRSGAVAWSPLGRAVIESYRPRLIIESFDDLLAQINDINDQMSQPRAVMTLTLPHNNPAKVIHFTDLHLMNDEKDKLTFDWLTAAVHEYQPDLIVITGDLTMSKDSVMLYHQLGQFMESLETPWTFVFGNHDIDHGIKRAESVGALDGCAHLLFEPGVSTYDRMGNFMIRLQSQKGITLQDLIFLDSGADTMYPLQDQMIWGYEVVSFTQCEWVASLLTGYQGDKKTVFVHIPLTEYDAFNHMPQSDYFGVINEGPSDAPFNTGLMDVLKMTNDTQAVWCGHDHYNDCYGKIDGILLGFGRVSGHYDYGDPTYLKGARLITYHPTQEMTLRLLLERDLGLPKSH